MKTFPRHKKAKIIYNYQIFSTKKKLREIFQEERKCYQKFGSIQRNEEHWKQ